MIDIPTHSQSSEQKKTMVAEPSILYDNDIRQSQQSPGRIVASASNIQPSGIRNSSIKF